MSELTNVLLELNKVGRQFGSEVAVQALADIDLKVCHGDWLAITGPSGAGKSTLLNIIGCLDRLSNGSYLFEGIDIAKLSDPQRAGLRSRRIGFVFQSFHLLPHRTVLENVMLSEVYRNKSSKGREQRARLALDRVGLSHRVEYLPSKLSGGERQRVAIARALMLQPKLVIADEPTSALDLSVQAQVLNLLQDLKQERGIAYLFVSHDLGVVEYIADTVAVMYLGVIVERAPRAAFFSGARHPYARALLDAVPSIDPHRRRSRRLLDGDVPSAAALPGGCRFRTRCPLAEPRCAENEPALAEVAPLHFVACHVVADGGGQSQPTGDIG